MNWSGLPVSSPVGVVTGSRKQPSPRLFVGEGKLEEIRDAVTANEADVVLFNHALSPSQERNIERELKLSCARSHGRYPGYFRSACPYP